MTNDECDYAILKSLDGRTLKFSQVYIPINSAFGPDKTIYRQVDRRLQALRKAGKVKFSHGFGWSLK